MTEFKKLHKWTDGEEAVLLIHFHDLPFSSHGPSRFDYLRDKLESYGFDVSDVTPKSISRKTYRLGLKSTKPNEATKEMECKYCGVKVTQKARYKVAVCESCVKIQKYKYGKTDRGKQYHREYLKEWRKTE
jgi:hypothetical protein